MEQPIPEPKAELTITHTLIGNEGRVQVLVEYPGGTFTDKLDITNAHARGKLVAEMLGRLPGLDKIPIEREVERIAAEVAKANQAAATTEGGSGGDDTKFLLSLAQDKDNVELFHVGQRQDAEAFATIRIDDHHETYAVSSPGFEHWMRGRYFEDIGGAPRAQAVADAVATIRSIAIFSGPQLPIALRVAGHEGDIYLDLADDTWRVVRITSTGWQVIAPKDCPVRFVRRRGMQALPEPQRGGSVNLLRPFVNFPDDGQWMLYIGSLPALFRPRGPYPVFVFSGEQGSAKSTTCKRTRSLIDPNASPIRTLPKDEGDLLIAANNSFVLVFDNLSFINEGMSDALCRLSTGGGAGKRKLYTDDDEKLFNVMRPVVLNGIEDVATKADLLDRSVLFALPTIGEDRRKEDATLDAEFEIVLPRILGALLDSVVVALRDFPSVVLARRPRMMDFARWCTAAEVGLGMVRGTFLDLYMANRSEAVELAIATSPVGTAVLRMMEGTRQRWEGTAVSLLAVLRRHAEEGALSSPEWPKAAHVLTAKLKRLKTPLRSLGLHVELGVRAGGRGNARLVRMSWLGQNPVPADAPCGRSDGPSSRVRPPENGPGGPWIAVADASDASDARIPTLSCLGEGVVHDGALTDPSSWYPAVKGPVHSSDTDPDPSRVDGFGNEASEASEASESALATPGMGFLGGRFVGEQASDETEPSVLDAVTATSGQLASPDKSEGGHTAHQARPEPPETLAFERKSEVAP